MDSFQGGRNRVEKVTVRNPPKLRVLIADDHALVRAGIRALVERLSGFEVVGEAANGRDAIELTRQSRPDIVAMDVTMADLNGVEATERIRREVPETKVLILSMHDAQEFVVRALRAGAAGYLLKDAAREELEVALRTVGAGKRYLSPEISRRAIESNLRQGQEAANTLERLTARQREILQMIAEGKTTKEIALLLNLSAKTVESHRAQLMDRLRIHDVPGLVRYAIRQGMVTADR